MALGVEIKGVIAANSEFRIAENLWEKSGEIQEDKEYIIDNCYNTSIRLSA